MSSFNLGKTIFSYTSISFLTRVIGLAIVIVITKSFGANLETDFYYYLIGFSMLFVTIITSGQSTVMIPFFLKIKNQFSEAEAWRFFNSLLSITMIISVIVALFINIFKTEIISILSSFPEIVIINNYKVVFVFSLIIAFMIINEVIKAILFANNFFTKTSIILLFANFFNLLIILIFSKKVGFFIVSLSLLFSQFFQFIFLLIQLNKNLKFFKLEIRLTHFREFLKLSYPVFLYQIFASFHMFYYDIEATVLSAGILTAVTYANRLFTLPNDIIVHPISQISFTDFSNSIFEDKRKLIELFYKYVSVLWFLIIPLSIYIYYYNLDIIKVFFMRGEFTINDSIIAAECLKLFVISLFAYSFSSVCQRILMVYEKNLQSSIAGVIISIFSMILVYYLVSIYDYKGIPLSRTISIVFFSGCSVLYLMKKYVDFFSFKKIIKIFFEIFIISIISFFLTVKIMDIFHFKNSFIILSVSTLFFVIIYLLINFKLKTMNFMTILKMIKV